jgi:nitrogen regulatory protein PII-like uncharacterized protein
LDSCKDYSALSTESEQPIVIVSVNQPEQCRECLEFLQEASLKNGQTVFIVTVANETCKETISGLVVAHVKERKPVLMPVLWYNMANFTPAVNFILLNAGLAGGKLELGLNIKGVLISPPRSIPGQISLTA